jgi:predicted NBD/HSP70 family sugar kinase
MNGPINWADSKAIRRYNLSLVLRQITEHGPRSRATLALETGLNKSTVSSLVAELIDGGLLRDAAPEDPAPGTVGRPPQNVELHPDGPFVLGLEVNVDYLAAWATDLAGALHHRSFVAHDNRSESPEQALGNLAQLAMQALAQPFADRRMPLSASVAVPGLVDSGGELVVAPNLGWADVPVAGLLREALEDPPFDVHVENEANLGAVAELVEGAGRGLRDFVYISGEIGIGAGVVLRGELFRGASGFAGEFGHLTIDPYGPPCGCGGRGCLERLAGQDALLRLAGWDPRMRCAGSRPEWPGAMLAQSAGEGHAKTLEALSQVGHTLGIAIASLANLLDPEAVLLGGYFAPLTPWLRDPIETELETRALAGRRWARTPGSAGRAATRSGCRIMAAQLGGEAAVRGAVAVSRRAALDLAAPAVGSPTPIRPAR